MDKPRLLAALTIAAAGAGVYANSFSAPFVFDDRASTIDNPTLRRASTAFFPPHGGGLTVEGRPLLNATFALNERISGSAVWSYHAGNLAIHIGAALLLLALLARALPLLAAFAAALVWTVHPLATEAVTYISQRAESLASCLCLLTLYGFARWCEGGARGWAALAIAACFAAMGAKEIAYCVPLLVLLYDRAFISGTLGGAWRRHRAVHLSLWACLAPLGLFMAGAGARGGTVGFATGVRWWPYVEAQFHSIAHYLLLCFWPTPLIFDYGTQWFSGWAVVPDAALVLGLLALTVIGLRRWPRAAFLGCVFFLILAPTSLVPGDRQTSAEHRMYLPLAAVVALVAASVEAAARRARRNEEGAAPLPPRTEAAGRRFHPALLLALAAIPLGAATIARNRVYRSAETLYRDSAAKLPDNAFAHYDLGMALRERGDWAGAAAAYRATLRCDPGMVHAASDLGDVLCRLRDWTGAEAAYRQSLALNPNDAAVRFGLGVALLRQGRAAEADEQFNDAALLDPGFRNRRPAP